MLKKYNPFAILALSLFVIVLSFFIYKLFIRKEIQLKKERSGNINILLLGKGGGAHEGPDLTDTIILASINEARNETTLFSIPRDLWVADLKSKINSAYSTGQGKNKQGLLLAKAAVGKVTGENVDYAVAIDFSGFEKVIDHLGGIDVDVKRTLVDNAYPIGGKEEDLCGKKEEEIPDLSERIATGSATDSEIFPCRYKTLRVEKGLQHMGGELALEFARSRHAFGAEGTDFARSQRQQEVISAIKEKVLSLGILLNPIKLFGIFNIIKDNVDTDIQMNEFDDFINLAQKMKNSKIKSYVLDFGDEEANRPGLLWNPPLSKDTGYQWILSPRKGTDDFFEIHEYIGCIKKGYVCRVEKNGISKEALKTN